MKHIMILLVSLSTLLPACGGGNITLNGAEVGEGFFGEFCAVAAECGFIAPNEIGVCVDVGVQAICDGGLCDEQYTLDEDEWNDCLNAISESSCAALDALVIPSECQTIEALQ